MVATGRKIQCWATPHKVDDTIRVAGNRRSSVVEVHRGRLMSSSRRLPADNDDDDIITKRGVIRTSSNANETFSMVNRARASNSAQRI